jgi:hypothetical protein
VAKFSSWSIQPALQTPTKQADINPTSRLSSGEITDNELRFRYRVRLRLGLARGIGSWRSIVLCGGWSLGANVVIEVIFAEKVVKVDFRSHRGSSSVCIGANYAAFLRVGVICA